MSSCCSRRKCRQAFLATPCGPCGQLLLTPALEVRERRRCCRSRCCENQCNTNPCGNPCGGYGGYGGGFGFPFLLPFFGFGGGFGGLFSILIFIAVANFLVQNVRRITGGNEEGGLGGEITGGNSSISVAKVQVGLLASARDLQPELNKLAMTADTSTAAGRSQVLQETTLALLRHPEYWAYGTTDSQKN